MRTRKLVPTSFSILSIVALCAVASPHYSEWSEPVNLAAVNSPWQDFGAVISKDGLSLYFSSDRPGGLGGSDIWVSRRTSTDDPWGAPENLGAAVNSSTSDSMPSLSRDEHILFFSSARPGGFGTQDIWFCWRDDVHDDLAWQPAVNAGPGINSALVDGGSTYFEGDEGGPPVLYFWSNRPGGAGATDIYVSELSPDGVFLPATAVAELNSIVGEIMPSIRRDGLELFMRRSTTGASLDGDLWVSTRENVFAPWSPPQNLGAPVNTEHGEQHVHIAPDRQTLLFSSNRPGGLGGFDIYVSTRTKNDR